MQNNDGTLLLQPTITSIGKKRLLEDQFRITKFALADDGVNYKLINENIIDPELAVKRTPVLSVWKDSSFNLNNKVFLDDIVYPSENDFNPSISNISESKQVHPKGFGKEINFPRVLKEEEVITIQFFITGNDIGDETHDLKIYFEPSMVEGNLHEDGGNRDNLKWLIATLSETRYFDIAVTTNNPNASLLRWKNFDSAFDVNEKRDKFPKTVNVYCGDTVEENNYFVLHYKGNFLYDHIDADIYETSINLSSEQSGKTQILKVQIIPTSKQQEKD